MSNHQWECLSGILPKRKKSNDASCREITMNFIECAWKVRPILEKEPATRDDDRLLIATVWQREIENMPEETQKIYSITEMLVMGLIENPETITRIRRKLQETIKGLRGEKWTVRHGMEAEAYNQLSFFDLWNY